MDSASPIDLAQLARDIRGWAQELGFQQVGIADVALDRDEAHLNAWLEAGLHGEMDYMARHGSKRARPAELVPGTQRVISVRMDYGSRDDAEAWEQDSDTVHEMVVARTDEVVDALRSCEHDVVVVTNEVGLGIVPEHRSGRLFRDLLGIVNQRVGAACDEVHLVVAGRVLRL